MLNVLFQNMYQWVGAVPTNLVIVLVVALVLKLLGQSLKSVIELVICYFLVCFILGMFGITLPPIQDIVLWVANWLKFLWVSFIG